MSFYRSDTKDMERITTADVVVFFFTWLGGMGIVMMCWASLLGDTKPAGVVGPVFASACHAAMCYETGYKKVLKRGLVGPYYFVYFVPATLSVIAAILGLFI